MGKLKVSYLHGRPAPHPMHGRFAKSVGGVFQYIDFRLRWQDLDKGLLYKLTSWVVCAFTYPDKKEYDVFLIDNLHFPPVIMKMLGLLRRNQKIVVHLGSHTLYFIYTQRFSRINNFLHRQALKRYDALICEGEMSAELVTKILGDDHPPIYTTFLGVPAERYESLSSVSPDLASSNIIVISNGPTEFRKWYKGMDLMIEAFCKAKQINKQLKLEIIGEWDKDVSNSLVKDLPSSIQKDIRFCGKTSGIESYLTKASLYLHSSRGDAFPTSSLEAMAAGVVPMVSEWTGTKQVVKEVDEQLITSLDTSAIANKILWYFNLPLSSRVALSDKCRTVVKQYTEENSIKFYQETFYRISRDFALARE